jgi:hypothetical protein
MESESMMKPYGMIPKKPATAKAGVAGFSDKIMRTPKLKTCAGRVADKSRAVADAIPC